ncbi:MAG: asparagine synthase-related protein, partial [Bryobacterales bacterium]
MAHGLEARVPFTDVELVEFLARVPSRVKYPGGDRKRLLRLAFGKRLPARTSKKKKIGLEMPYSRWFAEDWRDLLLSVLGSPERVSATGLLAPVGVRDLVDAHLARKADNGRALWALMQYVLWHERRIQGVRRDAF